MQPALEPQEYGDMVAKNGSRNIAKIASEKLSEVVTNFRTAQLRNGHSFVSQKGLERKLHAVRSKEIGRNGAGGL